VGEHDYKAVDAHRIRRFLLGIIALSARALREAPVDDQDALCPITITDCDKPDRQ
jgi:hypothetical protein